MGHPIYRIRWKREKTAVTNTQRRGNEIERGNAVGAWIDE